MSLFKRQKPPVETPGRQRRDLSGTSRPQAFSYYSQRSGSSLNTGRTAPEDTITVPALEKLTGLLAGNRLLIFAGVFAATALLGYAVWLRPEPQMVSLAAASEAYFMHEPREYEQAAKQTLSDSFLNRNKITVDTNKVSRVLTESYPEIKDVTVELPLFGNRPVVYIEPYTPSFILTAAGSTAYLLDENGRALVSASQIPDSGKLTLPTLHDKSGIKVKLGAQALPGDVIRFTGEVISILGAADISYRSLELPPASSELDVYIEGTPYFVKFNMQEDPRLQTGTFIATKLRLERDRITPGQYIDVRVPERAYYR